MQVGFIGAVLAVALGSVASAAPSQSPWKEGRFVELADWSFDQDGIRISNCHLAFFTGDAVQAVPRCYVMNRSGRPAQARVQFVAMDQSGEEVISATISAVSVPDMTGQEISQVIPISGTDRGKISRGKIRAWVSAS